jgi:hypothetical protein
MSELKDVASTAAEVSAVKTNLRTFASEITELSARSLEHTNDALVKLSTAGTLEELVAIQANYTRESFALLSEHARKLGELMTSFPSAISKTYAEAWSKSLNIAVEKTEAAKEKTLAEIERLSRLH